MEKKRLIDLEIGDRVYIVGRDWYEIAELCFRAVIDYEQYHLTFEVCGGGDEIPVCISSKWNCGYSVWYGVKDWGEVLITTDKDEVIDYYSARMRSFQSIIEKVKKGNEVVEEY